MRPEYRKCGGIFDVANREKDIAALESKMAEPDFWNDQKSAREVIDELGRHKAVTKGFNTIQSGCEDCRTLLDLAEAEPDEVHRAATLAEVERDAAAIEELFGKLEMASLLNGRLDQCNAYLSLHAGAGGTESCDWVDMLFRMYKRYCEDHGFEVSLLDMLPGEEAGLKSVTFLVSGEMAYGYLSTERGVHRLVRISPFDSNKRRHTSFASLDVAADLGEEIEVEIKDADLRVDTYRASGAGGQHVNKTDSAVRITHLPTGVMAACQSERSQHSNRTKAMRMLKARLYERMEDEKRQEMEKFYGEKGEIAWGHQIRSYVLQPYTMAKDHRTGVEIGNVARVLDGHLDPYIHAYLKLKRSQAAAG